MPAPAPRSQLGWHQPVGWPARATVDDPALPHQIFIANSGARLAVSCNCRARRRALGYFTTLEQAWGLYDAHLPAVQSTSARSTA